MLCTAFHTLSKQRGDHTLHAAILLKAKLYCCYCVLYVNKLVYSQQNLRTVQQLTQQPAKLHHSSWSFFPVGQVNTQRFCSHFVYTETFQVTLFSLHIHVHWRFCCVSGYNRSNQLRVLLKSCERTVVRAFYFALLWLGNFKTPGHIVGRLTYAPATTRLTLQLIEISVELQ